jgi:hypothetical protein
MNKAKMAAYKTHTTVLKSTSKKFNKSIHALYTDDTTISTGAEVLYDESEAKIFADIAYDTNCATKPLSKYCPNCLKGNHGYKFYFYFQSTRMRKFNYKFLIQYNDDAKKVLITFSAPNVQSDYKYFKKIYSKELYLVRFYQFKVEREFAIIYFGKLRKLLIEKIQKINESGRDGYSFVFNGYSAGASIATLAGFDLTKKGIVNKSCVFTFGSLRIGDAAFIYLVNTTIRVWRIVKANDYVIRTPSCYFNSNTKFWNCYNIKTFKH